MNKIHTVNNTNRIYTILKYKIFIDIKACDHILVIKLTL